uniref:Serine/threonine-protein phosphatase 2A 55 kDa regulatory subunit B n=1 Tax=Arcella intermedia TaxID=1963864 RepID=A0A6B2L3L5_9EUKA
MRRTKGYSDYNVLHTWAAHIASFDVLRSINISGAVTALEWLPFAFQSPLLLSSNEKTIKLWRITESNIKKVIYPGSPEAQIPNPFDLSPFGPSPLTPTSSPELDSMYPMGALDSSPPQRMKDKKKEKKIQSAPLVEVLAKKKVEAKLACAYADGAHPFTIHSLSANSDGSHFLSADDLTINMWNLEVHNETFSVLDLKPENMEDLSEVITTASFHPIHSYLFLWASSKGYINLCDMRQSTKYTTTEFKNDKAPQSFFREILSSISDVRFSKDGKYMLARDYMSLKLWDIRDPSKCISEVNVHDHLRPKLCDLYESDAIFDKFQCAISGDAKYFVTGSYNKQFVLHDCHANFSTTMSLRDFRKPALEPFEASPTVPTLSYKKSKAKGSPAKKPPQAEQELPMETDSQILNTSFHPAENTLALALKSTLYIYTY